MTAKLATGAVLLGIFKIDQTDEDLVQSQVAALSRQLPWLYAIGLLNAFVLAVLHFGKVPLWMDLVLPMPLCMIGIWRSIIWVRARGHTFTHQEAVERLRDTRNFSFVIGGLFASWALLLFSFDDAVGRAYTAFYIAMTFIPCTLFLAQLQSAVIAVALSSFVPLMLGLTLSGDKQLLFIPLNLLVICYAIHRMLVSYTTDYANLICARKQLTIKQKKTQALSDENFKLANLDSLSDLPNRRAFFMQCRALVAAYHTEDVGFAVGLIDLDGFKAVNDFYGHGTGDQVLIEVSLRLQALVGERTFLARLGGNEFAFLLHAAADVAEVEAFGQRVVDELSRKLQLATVNLNLTASVGIALCTHPGSNAEKLVEHADYALIHAKQTKPGTCVFFNEDIGRAMRAMRMTDQHLRRADFEAEISVVLQPIVYADNGRIKGYEALARWKSPVLGDVSPADFIKAAERTEIIQDLTLVLLRKTLAHVPNLATETFISFNLSARVIGSPETVLRILQLIRGSGVAPARISVEVTETALMADFERARHVLGTLRNLGCKIALDDFGSGYSSLSYVHKLPLDTIKIDRGFVTDIERDATIRGIVLTIVNMCRNLGLACIVEGVETAGQVETLKNLGCDAMQGYYFGSPFSPQTAALPITQTLISA